MITDLLSLTLVLLFVGCGLSRPYIALAGVIWIDLYKPQLMSRSFLAGAPLSLIMTAFFMFSLFLNIRKLHRPDSWLYIVLIPAFMGWITLTTYNAAYPLAAWPKHDIAFKTMLFAYFIPYVLRDRKQLELFLWVLIGSMGYFIVSAGAKSFLSGGGYGLNLVTEDDVLWSEGSTWRRRQSACCRCFIMAAGIRC